MDNIIDYIEISHSLWDEGSFFTAYRIDTSHQFDIVKRYIPIHGASNRGTYIDMDKCAAIRYKGKIYYSGNAGDYVKLASILHAEIALSSIE